ncbi:DUF5683 domain-containing protein [Bizionia paragorgiae]|uniref:DUF5683 domain-containing protein n=1 Tax=Bizionia paragorgiae TaxID=283786 RepID=UPI000A8B5F18|nr:DUF5683 domain-containing protein [Bizionia paragorgiae]MDX1272230.1 DUF5683 domain-containing protein [Bizionia paragorgiae]
MLNKTIIACVLCIACTFSALAQTKKGSDSTATKSMAEPLTVALDSTQVRHKINPLAPSRAAFYSAILPGLGQAYNKKYWKIPIVYAAIGTGIYFYIDNNNEYKKVRNAYKRRLAGFNDDQFQGRLTDDGLREAQKTLRRNKELSLLVTVGLYALNIIDANVDAHLLQYNIDDNLSFKPHYKIDAFDNSGSLGLTFNLKLD